MEPSQLSGPGLVVLLMLYAVVGAIVVGFVGALGQDCGIRIHSPILRLVAILLAFAAWPLVFMVVLVYLAVYMLLLVWESWTP